VIANGIDTAPVAAGEKEPVILAAGRLWDEAKNIAALTDLAGALPWLLRLAGPVRPDRRAGGAHVQAGEGVELLGALSRACLFNHMRRAAVFAAPALYEPFGLAVLEAASAGCALLLSDIPSFRELWEGAALFVDPRDRAAIRAGLERLCRESALRSWLQRAARRRARRYSLERTARAYADLYDALGLAASRRRHQPVGAEVAL
jgi:glycosyltransferase involved in cell wall biosynthesis